MNPFYSNQVSGSPEYLQPKGKNKSNHTKQYWHLYNQKRKDYLLKKQQEYRLKKQSLKPFKLTSSFQKNKTEKLLKLLVNHRSFVPVPQKLKHPVIKW